MCVAHRHLQGLMPQPHLHAPYIYAAANQARGASVAKAVGNDLALRAEAGLCPGVMPGLAEFGLADPQEGTAGPSHGLRDRLEGPARQRNGSAPSRLGKPESNPAVVDIAPA